MRYTTLQTAVGLLFGLAGMGACLVSQAGDSAATAPASRADAAAPGNGEQAGPPGRGREGPWHGGRGAGGPWRGGRGGGPPTDALFQADRELFHFLVDNRANIRRTVTHKPNGVETLTESDDPTVALAIQGHVEAMYGRVKNGPPIRMRDPLFAAVFRNARKIAMKVEKTDKGVRVVETSEDPYAVLLIQAHAAVVSRFLENGYPEVQANHEPPAPP